MSQDSVFKLFIRFWYQPGTATRQLIATNEGHGLAVAVAALFGGVQGWRIYFGSGGSILIIPEAALVGIGGLFLFGWLLRNFGRWFKAEAQVKSVRIALGLGLLPWSILFCVLIFVVRADPEGWQLTKLYPLFFGGFLYGYVIILLASSAALGISAWRTFFCLVITFLVSFFPLTLVAQILIGR